MNELLQRIALNPRLRFELFLSSLLINLLALASSLYSIQVLNRYLALGIDTTLLTLTVGALIAVFFEIKIRSARLRIAQWLCVQADNALGERVFDSSVKGQYALLEQLTVTARREILSGVATVQQCFGAPNLVSLLDAPFAIVFLLVLAMLNPVLAIATLAVMLIVSLISLLAQKQLRKPMEEQSRATIQLAGYQQTLAGNAEMVRAFQVAAPLRERWQRSGQELAELRAWINRLQNTIQNASYAGSVLLSMIVMAIGAREVLAGRLDVGSLIGANILASRALASLTRALGLGEPVGRGQRALELIHQLSAIPQERADGVTLGNFTGRLRFEDVAFAYPKQATPILERFDFEMNAGAVVVVCGANGRGKTTMARMIMGLLEPTRGRMLADGMEIRQADPNWWRRQVAYLPQEPSFFDGTLRENLCVLEPQASDEHVLSLCRELSIASFVEAGTEGLGMTIRNSGANVPVGIRRRLALVRALLGKGQLVVLDDPTEGVDAEGCKAIAAVLNRLVKTGHSIIVMSNEPFIISAAQVVIDLNQKPNPRIVRAAVPANGMLSVTAPEEHLV